jgi:hypothetical protein
LRSLQRLIRLGAAFFALRRIASFTGLIDYRLRHRADRSTGRLS